MMDDKEFKEENKYEYGSTILNSRSILSSYHNSSVEFFLKKAYVVTLIGVIFPYVLRI
jgi:hypothetical protein